MSGEKQLKSVCVCENCDPDNEKVKGQKKYSDQQCSLSLNITLIRAVCRGHVGQLETQASELCVNATCFFLCNLLLAAECGHFKQMGPRRPATANRFSEGR